MGKFKKNIVFAIVIILILATSCSTEKKQIENTENTIEIPVSTIVDKIRGGLLGQIIGNLNGLPHELKYNEEPGNVTEYIPALPDGARTDDDTDFEWVYIYNMQQKNTLYLSSTDIADLWKKSINKKIWCSNQYARYLMDIGIDPPLTGNIVLNPWAEFNISGQFLCETFGLLGPAMPQTASKIGLNYTSVAIDGEPAQTTQLFCSMIATAFIEDDIYKIIEAGRSAIDENSVILQIIDDVSAWHEENPDDWKKTRLYVKEKYMQDNGSMRDINGHELNTAAIIASLLYGQGDFIETAKLAFNFGWDADCNAATALTIVGTMMGYKWMMSQGWQIVDRYKNTSRDGMPMDETITSFADRLVELAEKSIINNNGKKTVIDGRLCYQILVEEPKVVYPLNNIEEQMIKLKKQLGDDIRHGILNSEDSIENSRAAYLAVCLNMSSDFRENNPEQWQEAVNSLNYKWKVMQRVFYSGNWESAKILRNRFDKEIPYKPKFKVQDWRMWNINDISINPEQLTDENLNAKLK